MKMKHDRKAELIALCNGIIRNADNITSELEFNQNLTIKMSLCVNEIPNVEITKEFVPHEVIDVWNEKSDE